MFVVLVGPDGSGKSTVARALPLAMAEQFSGSWHFHWRPKLLASPRRHGTGPASPPAVSAPPNKQAYGFFLSLVRFLYYWIDFTVGYWVRIHPRLRAGQLVVGERYFPDILVHPQRYGFALPVWLMRVFGGTVPAPDATILLAASAEVVRARKDELSLDVIRRQFSAYEREIVGWGTSYAVDTEGGVDAAVRGVVEALTRHSGSRYLLGDRIFPRLGQPRLLLNDWPSRRHAYDMAMPTARPLWRPLRWLLARSRLLQWLTSRRAPPQASGIRVAPEEVVEAAMHALKVDAERDPARANVLLGGVGPRAKMTIQFVQGDRVTAYAKMANAEPAASLIRSEADNLRLVNGHFSTAITPKVRDLIELKGWTCLLLSAPSLAAPRGLDLEPADQAVLKDMTGHGRRSLVLKTYLDELNLRSPDASPLTEASSFAANAIAGAARWLEEHAFDEVELAWSHGDYTPWNTRRLSDGRLFVLDWEDMSRCRPVLHDLLHFFRMPHHLIRETHPEDLVRLLLRGNSGTRRALVEAARAIGVDEEKIPTYLMLYSLLQILAHARLAIAGNERHRAGQESQMRYLAGMIAAVGKVDA